MQHCCQQVRATCCEHISLAQEQSETTLAEVQWVQLLHMLGSRTGISNKRHKLTTHTAIVHVTRALQLACQDVVTS